MAFKKAYVEPVLDGRKTTTLRRYTMLRPGDVIDATCEWGKPPFAKLRVRSVTELRGAELTEEDAHSDGFESLQELRTALTDHYPTTTSFFKVEFVVLAGR